MSQYSRPNPGYLARFLVPLVLSLGFAACSPKTESVPDTWKLTPPSIDLTNSAGASIRATANDFQNSKTSPESLGFADDLAYIRFASDDVGLNAIFQTRCASGGPKTAEFRQTAKTAARFSILPILPPETLHPSALTRDWFCDIEMTVTNSAGSISRGRLLGVKIHFASAITRISSETSAGNSTVAATSPQARMICSSWWTEGSSRDLHELASASSVQGIDNRATERTPWCTVLELGGSPKLIQILQPLETTPKLAIDREALFPKSSSEGFYARPLMAWTIRNATPFRQLIFIPNPKDLVKISVRSRLERVLQWTRHVGSRAALGHNATDYRQTDQGLYARLLPGESARVHISGTRKELISFIDFSKQADSTHLVLIANRPFEVFTVANEHTIGPLNSVAVAELKLESPGFLNSDQQILLDKVLMENSASSLLILSPADINHALTAVPTHVSCMCFIGPGGMVMNEPSE